MPTSDVHNIVPILTVIQGLRPRSVLDIGCGFGKYGVLLREYLDVWQERLSAETWQVRLEAIDAFSAYRNPIWDYIYQKVHIGQAQTIVPRLGDFDVILIADVIEHLEHDQAVELVDRSLAKCRGLIVSTPKEFYPQEDTNDNPYETHRILWTRSDFPHGTHVRTIPGLACNIFVASRRPIPWQATYVADLRNVLYLRSRNKLRKFGRLAWPVSTTLRWLNRLLA
jgi:2-polyprenyl-3-methyl-5-hydroxy-6-metoxy-1,4-benzoquinol methylase